MLEKVDIAGPRTPQSNCAVAGALDVVADPWTFLVLREAWFGVRRFEGFRAALGMPRGTLSARLRHLVAQGLFRRIRYRESPERFEYRLTEKGGDLYPGMLIMLAFGDRWLAGDAGPPLLLRHDACGQPCSARVSCSECARALEVEAVTYRPGPGAGENGLGAGQRTRRSSRPENFLVRRACSVARTLQIIGDRWTFLLIREAFFGVHRFDEVRQNLGIATNILSNRLGRLVEHGVFERRRYASGAARHEYRFTPKGRDLYPSMLALLRWGDDWLFAASGAPLRLRHARCGADFRPQVTCSACGGVIRMQQMSHAPGPGALPLRG